MKSFKWSIAAAATIGATFALAAPTKAAPIGLIEHFSSQALPNLVEKTQFIFGGRHYCFYPDGWHGTGWYWCGYSHRRGRGWGGPRGWHGWHHDRGHMDRHDQGRRMNRRDRHRRDEHHGDRR